jgi:predicted ATPase
MIIENESELANHGKLVDSETEDDLNEVEDFLQNEQTIKLILTEPETNLHPDLQTKFCKLIIHIATDFNVSFMIETHSEYFIRSLELELASKKTKKSKINIYYFENIKGKGTKIKPIGINEFGLTKNEFGSGFLDESQKTIENILKIKEN